jgi:O-antigen/teichoic acid export membrane protein
MRRDVASAYFASATRIASWVIVSGLVYRLLGPPQFALLALIRGTIGLLNYISLGLAPALIHEAAHARSDEPSGDSKRSLEVLHTNAMLVAVTSCAVGVLAAGVFAFFFGDLFRVAAPLPHLRLVVLFMGLGTLLRLTGDAPGAFLQIHGMIARDNLIVAVAELVWTALCVLGCWMFPTVGLYAVAISYAISGALNLAVRQTISGGISGATGLRPAIFDTKLVRRLLAFGGMVVLAQLADYLYAPTDYILINRLLNPVDVANYAPAVQLDAGLLLLVSSLSAVMLPKAAIAHARGDADTVARYYFVATTASLILLTVATTAVWLLSPWIFRLWLGNSMPVTRSILPIVLVNTVIGGGSSIGRSILLAVGRVRPFTISVLIAGVINVVCSYAFVRFFDWGLRGIVLGTVVAVVGRCVIWMPWYVMRTVRAGGT